MMIHTIPKFIEDDARIAAKNAVLSHIRRQSSLLICGHYGVGKTALLKRLLSPNIVNVNPLGGAYQILGRMVRVYDANPRNKQIYLNILLAQPRTIFIDEAQHLPKEIFPYLKLIMDAGNSVVAAGLFDLYDILRTKHPDVLSRMTLVRLPVLNYDDMLKLVPDFEESAFEAIYGQIENMREIIQVINNCRDYIKKGEKITVNTVLKFLPETNNY